MAASSWGTLQVLAGSPLLSLAFAGFAALGFVRAARCVYSWTALLADLYLAPSLNLNKYGAGTGGWAVVTGASDGIGKEFALQLAQKGMNVVLVSRTPSKLQAIATEIEEKYGVDTRIYAMDFFEADQAFYDDLRRTIQPLNVSILVNNVGTSHPIPTPFIEESDSVINGIIDVNIKATMKITKMIVPKMIAQKRGLILNIGSFAGMVPSAYLSVYSGSKAFLSAWSQALAGELAPRGLTVRNVNTYFVASAMSKIRRATPTVPTPRDYVHRVLRGALRPGGARDGDPYTTTPYPTHAVIQWVMDNFVPKRFLVAANASMQQKIRARALKKQQHREVAKED